jgi:hypothetical protein
MVLRLCERPFAVLESIPNAQKGIVSPVFVRMIAE